MDWLEEREKLLKLFEMYPGKAGSRTDLKSENKYSRYKIISDAMGGRWSTNGHLQVIEEMLNNDTDTYFFAKGIIKYNWTIPSTHRIFKDGYYDYDKNNDNVIVGKIDNDEIGATIKDVIKVIRKHYKITTGSYLYFMEIKDGEKIFPYRKIGISNNLTGRIKMFNTNIPFEIHPIAIWEVEYGKSMELETFIHKQLQDVHKKGEWFLDYEFNLVSRVRSIIRNVEHINTKEVFDDERLQNVDEFSDIMKSLNDFECESIETDDNLILVTVNKNEGFGFIGDF